MAINRWLSTVRRLTRSRTSSGSPTGVEEGAGASLGFVVWMEQPATGRVTVEYATADDTAKAGEDYTAMSGALAFEPGERKRTVSVPVLDDPHDEGEETMRLRLSNATGGRIVDDVHREATGTIENIDLMPAALARFGRATAEQVVTHIEQRMAAPRRRGFRAGRGAGAAAGERAGLLSRGSQVRILPGVPTLKALFPTGKGHFCWNFSRLLAPISLVPVRVRNGQKPPQNAPMGRQKLAAKLAARAPRGSGPPLWRTPAGDRHRRPAGSWTASGPARRSAGSPAP